MDSKNNPTKRVDQVNLHLLEQMREGQRSTGADQGGAGGEGAAPVAPGRTAGDAALLGLGAALLWLTPPHGWRRHVVGVETGGLVARTRIAGNATGAPVARARTAGNACARMEADGHLLRHVHER